MVELVIDNRNGNIWDISGIVSDVTWRTSRIGRPGSLEFTLIKGGIYQNVNFQYNSGDVVRFRYNGQNVFYGYIFSVDRGKDEDVRILAYDQIRYLLAEDTYVFSNATATEIIRRIAQDFGLRVGQLEDTGYRIPTMVEDGQKLLDIIDKALVLTLWNTNRNYVFYDDAGALSLRNVESTLLDIILGDGSLMYDYRTKTSIDDDTYNVIKLYKDNRETGKREVYVAQDSENIAKWGRLQLYQSVDEEMNAAQIQELLDQLIILKNRETKSLRIDAIGDIRVRAGWFVRILIEELGINQPFLVNECTHRFDGVNHHTMSLDLEVV